jgi:hypothetical protein
MILKGWGWLLIAQSRKGSPGLKSGMTADAYCQRGLMPEYSHHLGIPSVS